MGLRDVGPWGWGYGWRWDGSTVDRGEGGQVKGKVSSTLPPWPPPQCGLCVAHCGEQLRTYIHYTHTHALHGLGTLDLCISSGDRGLLHTFARGERTRAHLPPHPFLSLQGFMQTYLYSQALKEQQLQQQSAMGDGSVEGGLQEGGLFSASLQRLLQGTSAQGSDQAAPKGLNPSRSLLALDTVSGETVLTTTASEPASAAPSAVVAPTSRQGPVPAAEDWEGQPAADPLFLTIFDACRSIAAAHLSPVVGQVQPVMTSRSGRRNSMPVGLFTRQPGLVPDSPPIPQPASAAAVVRPGSVVDVGLITALGGVTAMVTASTATTASDQGIHATNTTVGSSATNRTAGQLTAAGVERTPSGLHSGSLWSALLNTNNSQTLSQAEAGGQNLLGPENAVWSMG